MYEGLASMINLSADALANSPMALIGTPERCAAELRRRANEWRVEQFIFSFQLGMDENLMRRLREEVIPAI